MPVFQSYYLVQRCILSLINWREASPVLLRLGRECASGKQNEIYLDIMIRSSTVQNISEPLVTMRDKCISCH